MLQDKILFYFMMQQVFALQLHLKTAEIKFAMQGPCSNASDKHESSLLIFFFSVATLALQQLFIDGAASKERKT